MKPRTPDNNDDNNADWTNHADNDKNVTWKEKMEITSLAGGENPGGMADEHPPQDDYDGHAEDDDGGGLAVKTPTLSDSGLWTGQALAPSFNRPF